MELVAGTELDCPICLLKCKFPALLPCGHIFCFLCVKGVQNRRCAMCRREIPPEFLERPCLMNGVEDILRKYSGYQWFYEGRNGWWQYDDRTSKDIEDAFQKDEKSCTILVAGNVYVVDLETMLQQRQNEPARCRRVKRDLATVPKKGVAGLRIEGNAITTDAANSSTSSNQQSSNAIVANDGIDVISSSSSTASGVTINSSLNNLLSPVAAANAAINIAATIPDSTVHSETTANSIISDNGGEHHLPNGENELILNNRMGLIHRDTISESANNVVDDGGSGNISGNDSVQINSTEIDHRNHRPINDNYEQVLIDLLMLQAHNITNPTSDEETDEHSNVEEHFNVNRQT